MYQTYTHVVKLYLHYPRNYLKNDLFVLHFLVPHLSRILSTRMTMQIRNIQIFSNVQIVGQRRCVSSSLGCTPLLYFLLSQKLVNPTRLSFLTFTYTPQYPCTTVHASIFLSIFFPWLRAGDDENDKT